MLFAEHFAAGRVFDRFLAAKYTESPPRLDMVIGTQHDVNRLSVDPRNLPDPRPVRQVLLEAIDYPGFSAPVRGYRSIASRT